MSILDQPERWDSIDPRPMRSLLESFPDQASAAARTALALSFPKIERPRNLVITGLGGSAIGGDIARCVLGADLDIPLLVNRDYTMPGFVNSGSAVIACSYSGNTEETLIALQQAKKARAAIVCITSGGRLQEMARADGFPLVLMPAGLPPRAAIGHAAMALFGCISALGLVPDVSAAFEETHQVLRGLLARYAGRVPESENTAKRIAGILHGKIAGIYGSSGLMDAAAARWRSQIEENAKNLAFHHLLPEMNHNELVGWLHPGEVLRQVAVVFLRDKGEHPQLCRRFDLTREVIEERAGAVLEVWSEGETKLARTFSTVYLGDWVSLYLAYLNQVDPTPVEVIESFKERLAAAASPIRQSS